MMEGEEPVLVYFDISTSWRQAEHPVLGWRYVLYFDAQPYGHDKAWIRF